VPNNLAMCICVTRCRVCMRSRCVRYVYLASGTGPCDSIYFVIIAAPRGAVDIYAPSCLALFDYHWQCASCALITKYASAEMPESRIVFRECMCLVAGARDSKGGAREP
jgi:hypothetical protein